MDYPSTNITHSLRRTSVWLFLTILVCLTPSAVLAQEKIPVGTIVTKHLESIGKPGARAEVTTRTAKGAGTFRSRFSQIGLPAGPAMMASEGRHFLLSIHFGLPAYDTETVIFDGKKVLAGYITPGARSLLGNYLLTNLSVAESGLMGSVLSLGWPLLNFEKQTAKFEYAGTKKLKGRACYVLRYTPKGGSEVSTKLFFDAETFHHVRTEYERLVPAPMGRTPEESARTINQRSTMVELFEDFKEESGFMLPHTYSIEVTVNGQTTSQGIWSFTFDEFLVNQTLSPDLFTIR